MNSGPSFSQCVKFRWVRGGWVVECRKGQWGVEAPTFIQAYTEAQHYWHQYAQNGEYDDLIAPANPQKE